MRLRRRIKKGFTFIEALTVLFIASVVIVTFLNVFSQGSYLLLESKKNVTATSLANERMETIRNLAYDFIGVSGGIPDGVVIGSEVVNKDNVDYTIATDIRFFDDPYDGVLGGTPNDAINTDQKQVTVTVSWGNESTQNVRLSTLFVPPGVESAVGSGTLSINVIDSTGNGVPSASVRVVNASEGIDFTTTTDSSGNVFLPGAPAAVKTYGITVSKSDYETVVTQPPFPTTSYIPVDEHASVFEGSIFNKVIVSDALADITLNTVNSRGESIADVLMTISGGRDMGTDTEGKSVFGVENQEITTDGSGTLTLDAMSPGSYSIDLRDASSVAYSLVRLDPGDSQYTDMFSVASGSSDTYEIVLADLSETTLLVKVLSSVDGTPLSGASVTLENTALSYNETLVTDVYGYAFFPDGGTDPLIDETYTLSVSLSGYGDENDNVSVSGFTEQEVQMTP